MKVSFIVPCRNKAHFVAKTLNGIFAQTYSPMEIVLSDQGSTDGSLAVLHEWANKYNGPNKIRVIECPETEYKGMVGLNTHLNWIHSQIDSDIVICSSADDLNHPMRAMETVRAFEEFKPSYVATCTQFTLLDGTITGFTGFPDQSRFVTGPEHIEHLVGSSSSPAWSHDLWDKYPLRELETQDVTTPFWATLERGLYYLHLPLFAHIKHEDVNNTGIEGQLRAAKTEAEKSAYLELVHYHVTAQWFYILSRIEEEKIKVSEDVLQMLAYKALHNAACWVATRNDMTLKRISPLPMKV